MCDNKDIVWIALQTDTNSIKLAIRFELFSNPSTPNHFVQWNLHFLGFQMTYST